MIAAIIVIVIVFFIILFLVGAISAWTETSQRIERYYAPPASNASKAVLDQYQVKTKRRLYTQIFALLDLGRSDRDIARSKHIIEYGDNAGIRIAGADTIHQIKVSREFLEANNLFLKLSNLIELGYDNKSIAKKLVPRGSHSYTYIDIQNMRDLLNK